MTNLIYACRIRIHTALAALARSSAPGAARLQPGLPAPSPSPWRCGALAAFVRSSAPRAARLQHWRDGVPPLEMRRPRRVGSIPRAGAARLQPGLPARAPSPWRCGALAAFVRSSAPGAARLHRNGERAGPSEKTTRPPRWRHWAGSHARGLVHWCVGVFVLATTAAAQAAEQPDPTELVFGIISTESATGLREGFDPFLAKLSQNLGMPIKGFYASDYAGVIEAMRFGKVHIAWMGAQAAIHAVDRAGAEVIAQTTGGDGRTGYASIILVHERSPYRDIDGLLAEAKSLTFGNGDPLSTTGYLLPNYYLWAPRGIDPRRAFKQTRNANHEANALAVSAGHVDFATGNTESLERLRRRQPATAAKLRVIWQSPDIPTDPILCRSNLSRELKTRLQAAFLAFGRLGPDGAKERAMLLAVSDGWGPFLTSDNGQLRLLRRMEIERDRTALQQDERLPPSEKQKRLAALQERERKLQDYEDLSTYWNGAKTQR